mgnify:CR=1 FL=1
MRFTPYLAAIPSMVVIWLLGAPSEQYHSGQVLVESLEKACSIGSVTGAVNYATG